MKRSGSLLEKAEKKKRVRKVYSKDVDYVDDGKYDDVTTYGEKILPVNIKKYDGSVRFRKDKKTWRSCFNGEYKHLSRSTHKTKEEAEAYVKQINVSLNLVIKNIIYRYEDDYYCVLTQKQVMLFAAQHLAIVESSTWRADYDRSSNAYYATTRRSRKDGPGPTNINFHILALPGIKQGETVDHKNRVTLDNRPFNLRVATQTTQSINQRKHSNNTSGVIGVYHHPKRNQWIALWKESGKPCQKSFSVSKYGSKQAKVLAIAKRKEMEETLPEYRLALGK